MRLITGITLGVVVTMASVARGDVVERRGGVPPLVGTVTRFDDGGVVVKTDSGAEHAVAWDRVRSVVTDRPAPRAADYAARSLDLWRARSRVERGDHRLAEPLLARWFESYQGQTSELALIVAEGLLRCQIARGAHASAVIPALEVARLRHAGVTTDRYTNLAPAMDAVTLLCPEIAPFFVHDAALDRLERDLQDRTTAAGETDHPVDDIARLYLVAIQRQRGQAAPIDDITGDHAGVRLLAEIVSALASDAGARETGRAALARGLDDRPEWARVWSRFAVGASLLGERGVGRHQRGMIELLHLPARDDPRSRYLAGLALAWVAEASRRDEDAVTARVMQDELARRFPLHPALATPQPVQFRVHEETS